MAAIIGWAKAWADIIFATLAMGWLASRALYFGVLTFRKHRRGKTDEANVKAGTCGIDLSGPECPHKRR